jgi:hypothetical protein
VFNAAVPSWAWTHNLPDTTLGYRKWLIYIFCVLQHLVITVLTDGTFYIHPWKCWLKRDFSYVEAFYKFCLAEYNKRLANKRSHYWYQWNFQSIVENRGQQTLQRYYKQGIPTFFKISTSGHLCEIRVIFTKVALQRFWMIDYLLFYVPLMNFSLIWRRHHYRRKATKFRPLLSAQGLWAGRDLYRATPAVTQGLSFSGLIRRTAPYDTQWDVEDLF